MIYVLAANLEDARRWVHDNGLSRRDATYVGQSWNLPRAFLDERDRIVRTARHDEHPGARELERMVAQTLTSCGLTETVHGRLVRREA